MTYLIISIIAYLIGPIIYQVSRESAKGLSFLDGFVFTSISGLVIYHFTEIIDPSNFLILSFILILGIFAPNIFERVFHSYGRQIHLSVIFLGIFGFLLHVFFEAALIHLSEDHDSLHGLMLGIIIHRLPVGLVIWWLLRPRLGSMFALLAIGLLILSNFLGFYFGEQIDHHSDLILYLQTFLTGSILHVVFYNFHIDKKLKSDCCHTEHRHEGSTVTHRFEGVGNLFGLAFLFLIFIFVHGHHDETNMQIELVDNFLELFFLSAPALLIAYLLSGLLKSLITLRSLVWFNSGNRVAQSGKGVLFGLPLPICSCGVLPFYKTLVDKGLAPAAALSFLIATPELGLDAILISFPLLGKELTLVRVLAAFVLAILIGIFLSPLLKAKEVVEEEEEEEQLPLKAKLKEGFHFSLTKLVDDTAPWILAGIILAAFFHVHIGELNRSLFGEYDILLAGLIGIVVYVCASGATPIVAVLVAGGLSPGAAITFLLTGPATNISTFGVLKDMHSKKFALYFASVTFFISVALGYLVNFYFQSQLALPQISGHAHESASWFTVIVSILVMLIFLSSIYRNGARKFCGLA